VAEHQQLARLQVASGGYLAQLTNLGVPYLARAGVLVVMFVVAMMIMHDLGFTPDHSQRPLAEMKLIIRSSVDNGLKVPAIRATMMAGVFSGGVGMMAVEVVGGQGSRWG